MTGQAGAKGVRVSMIWIVVSVAILAALVWVVLRYNRFTNAIVDSSHQGGRIPMQPDDKNRR